MWVPRIVLYEAHWTKVQLRTADISTFVWSRGYGEVHSLAQQ